MHSGAINRFDISVSHEHQGEGCERFQVRLGEEFGWCTQNSPNPLFLQIKFNQVTIVTGYSLKHLTETVTLSGHYFGYSFENDDISDFQYIFNGNALLVSLFFSFCYFLTSCFLLLCDYEGTRHKMTLFFFSVKSSQRPSADNACYPKQQQPKKAFSPKKNNM